MSSSKLSTQEKSSAEVKNVRTTGEIFDDGTCIELVRDAETNALGLCLCRDGTCEVSPHFEFRNRIYIPADNNPPIVSAMNLPGSCGNLESTPALFSSACAVFTQCGFSEDIAQAAVYFVFSTWVADCVPTAPCLLISGPSSEAQFLLTILSLMTRHPLMLGAMVSSAVLSLAAELQPTLLIADGEEMPASVWNLFRISSRRNVKILSNGSLVSPYCAKAIYCGCAAAHHGITDAMSVSLVPSRQRLQLLTIQEEQAITHKFQSMMFSYRRHNFPAVLACEFDLPGLSSGTRILARSLGAAIVGAPDLQLGLRHMLRGHEESAQAGGWSDPRCIAIEAVLYLSHENEGPRVHIGEITRTANVILKGRGEATVLEPKTMGAILRQLGFTPSRDSRGYSIRLDDTNRRRIHARAREFDVASVEMPLCALCVDGGIDEPPANVSSGPIPR